MVDNLEDNCRMKRKLTRNPHGLDFLPQFLESNKAVISPDSKKNNDNTKSSDAANLNEVDLLVDLCEIKPNEDDPDKENNVLDASVSLAAR